MDIEVGIEAEVCINEHLEALARGSAYSERHTTHFNTCPHATQGFFRLDQDEIRSGELTVEIGPPRTVCSWCRGAEWVSISAIAREFLLPRGVDIRIGSYLSYEMKHLANGFTTTEEPQAQDELEYYFTVWAQENDYCKDHRKHDANCYTRAIPGYMESDRLRRRYACKCGYKDAGPDTVPPMHPTV